MSDPTQIPEVAGELGKVGAGGGLGWLAAKLVDRFFTKADKDAGKLDQVLAAVQGLDSKLGVITERQTTTRADVDKLEAAMLQLQLQVAELKGAFTHLTEQLAK